MSIIDTVKSYESLYSISCRCTISKERKKGREGGEEKFQWKRFRVGNRWRKKVDENVISVEFDRPPISAYFSKGNGREEAERDKWRWNSRAVPTFPSELRTNWNLGTRRGGNEIEEEEIIGVGFRYFRSFIAV